MIRARSLSYGGDRFTIYGIDGDPYFEHVTLGDPSNDFFSFVIESTLSKDAVVFDIGANIGLTTLTAARRASQVVAFEPQPTTHACLVKTIEANRLKNIRAVELALGATKGEISFFADSNSSSASHIIADSTLGRQSDVKVEMTTLDNFVEDESIRRIDLIKIDVEGFEIDAISGAKNTLYKLRPAIFVEFNAFTMIGFRNINPRQMLDTLRETFPYVYRWRAGAPLRISNDSEALSFLHDNLVSAGCVDDLYCSFESFIA